MNVSDFLNDFRHHASGETFTPVRWPGIVIIILSIICIIVYVLCLFSIIRNKDLTKLPSYQILLQIGLTDLTQLFFLGIVGGIFSLSQNVFDFYFNKIAGGILNSVWIVSVTLADLLAWNRLLQNYDPRRAKRIFNMRNTKFMIMACWVYGSAWFVAFMCPSLDLLYTPSLHNWDYGFSIESRRFALFELVQDGIQSSSIVLCYVAIVYRLIKQANQISSNQINSDQKEKLVLFQSMWICFVIVFAVILFFFNTSIIPNHWASFFATLVWLACAGGNGFMYLIFNRTIRHQVKRIFSCSRQTVTPLAENSVQ